MSEWSRPARLCVLPSRRTLQVRFETGFSLDLSKLNFISGSTASKINKLSPTYQEFELDFHLVKLSIFSFRLTEYTKAIKYCERIMEMEPGNSQARQLMEVIKRKRKRTP